MNKKHWTLAALVIVCLLLVITFSTNSEEEESFEYIKGFNDTYEETKQKIEIENESLDMSLDEKIGQLIMGGVSGTTLNDNDRSLIKDYHLGGVIFFSDNLNNPSQIASLVNDIKKTNSENPLPLLLGVDQEGGRVTRLPGIKSLPTNEKIGEVNDLEFTFDFGELLGKQLNAFGFNINFAPVLDINSNPNNTVIGDRAFGNTTEKVSNHGIQLMKGIESQQIIPVIKHFPGHGDTKADSHIELPVSRKSIEQLKELELKPFQNAIRDGADVVMIAHILYSKIDDSHPSSYSKPIITDLLREQLNYDGVVITDDMTMQAITKYVDIGQAAVKSIQAGSDIIMVAHDYNEITNAYNSIKKAVENGEITEERIDQSVKRIMQLKEKYKVSRKSVTEANINQLNEDINQLLNQGN
ncbi:beta-N-acetylhexosaminidase [Filobacillus milosensis]|uniref:Beta-N-acetylhexosaminidase n=1 Tax=Filobacillus milosensis TaxID=94137 RepID=A0A4Y8IGE2_9BACI|nr:beta-N-acetylhexosaminidase [Filobacillus milosensis]TFB14227.1 beta-N-acetylhexosaminidase [Filobacillus milosensis]